MNRLKLRIINDKIDVALYTAYINENIIVDDIDYQEENCRRYASSFPKWNIKYYCEGDISNEIPLAERPQMQNLIKNIDKYKILLIYDINILGSSSKNIIDLADLLNIKKINLCTIQGYYNTSLACGEASTTFASGVEKYINDKLSEVFLIFSGKHSHMLPWSMYKGPCKRIEQLTLMLNSKEFEENEWFQLVSMKNMKVFYEHVCSENNTLKTDKEKIISDLS